LCRKHTTASFPRIGESFGRDHSSIIHGVRAISGRMEAEPAFRLTVKRIEQELGLFSQGEFHEDRELSSGC
jgi:chromosomal replication initiation ATPase DnaA